VISGYRSAAQPGAGQQNDIRLKDQNKSVESVESVASLLVGGALRLCGAHLGIPVDPVILSKAFLSGVFVHADPDSRPPAVLARTLHTTEYFTLAFGTMVGVGWLLVIDDWLGRGGPGGAMLGFLLGGLALVPIGIVYGRFVREIPDAASECAYATRVFPPVVGYLAAWLMTLAYLIVCPWETVAIGKIMAYVFPSMQEWALYSVGGKAVYLPSILLGFAVIAFVTVLNYRGIRLSARFLNLTTFGLLLLFAAFTVLGFTRYSGANVRPFFSRADASWGGAAVSIILVLQIVPYFLTGFESVPKCSEEAHEQFNPLGFIKAILLALAVGTVFYVVIIWVVSGLVPWRSLVSERFATAVAFERAFGSPLLVRLIILAAVLSLLKIFNANFLTASRLIFALGRQGMLPPGMGTVHPRFQSPTSAVLFCCAITIFLSLFGESILIPVTEVGSLCSALGWLVTCLAFVRWRSSRPAGDSTRGDIAVAVLGAIVAFTLLLLKVVPYIPGSFRRWEYVSLAVWLLLGLLLRKRLKA